MTDLAINLSNEISALYAEYTGRGATRARTYVHENLIVVVLHDSLTRGEAKLLEDGRDTVVWEMRRAYQEAMRKQMVAIVERLSGRNVLAFVSGNELRPDVAIESFTLELRNGMDEEAHEGEES